MSRTPKTQEEIDAEVKALKEMQPKVRRYSIFNEDNWAKMDIAIRVLEEDMDQEGIQEFLDRELKDEAITEDQVPDLDSIGYDTIQWREGYEVDYAPAEGWKSLVHEPVEKEEPEPKKEPKKSKRRK